MKKYLMTGAAAIALCVGFVSCSSDEDVYDPQAASNLVKAQYDAAFVSTFGQPAATQDWGFGSSASRTRSVIKADMTDYPSATAPAAITDAERTYVTNWFKENSGLSEVGLPWTEFYIQWVSGDNSAKKGIWHRYDQNRVNNGYESNYWDEEFTDNATMDYLIVSDNNGYKEHVNDFNANGGGPFGVVYMKNSSALYFGYHSSWDGNDYQYFKLAEIDVPGVGRGYYVGLSIYGKKYDNGDKELGIQRLQYAEDWILKIVPGNQPANPAIRVFAEDLSATDASDFDFNDVVFDATYVSENQVKIKVWAAGGTLPLQICSKDGVTYGGGFEVHDGFGVPVKCMVNTHAYPIIQAPGYTAKDELPAYERTITLPENIADILGLAADEPTQFSRENFAYTVKTLVRLEVNKGAWYELGATQGEPACKIAGPTTNDATKTDWGARWLLERTAIQSGYPDFESYVGTGYPTNWWSNEVNAAMYSKSHTPKGFTVECDEAAPHE